ncbi:MAG: MFS transporter [Limnochordia bacterium]
MIQYVTISLGHAVVDLYMNTLPSLLPFLIAHFDLSFTLVGILIAVRAVSGSFTQPLFGYFVDQGGRGTNLVYSLVWLALLTALLGLVPSYGWLVLLIILGPLGSALYHPLGSALLRQQSTPEQVGSVTSIYIVSGTIGYAIGPIAVVTVVMKWGLAGTVWLAIPGIIVAILLVASGVLGNQLGAQKDAPSSVGQVKKRWGEDWLASRGQVFLLSLAATLRSWAYTGLVNYLPVFYVSQGYSPQYGSYMLTLYLFSGSIGTLIGGRLSDQWGRKNVTILTLLIAAVTLPLYLVSSGILKVVFLALTGLTVMGSMSVTTVHAQELMVGNTALASGLMMGLVYGLGGIGSAISGRLADIYGLPVALGSLAVVLIPAILSMLPVPDPHQEMIRSRAIVQ